jgi:hypothetical protein
MSPQYITLRNKSNADRSANLEGHSFGPSVNLYRWEKVAREFCHAPMKTGRCCIMLVEERVIAIVLKLWYRPRFQHIEKFCVFNRFFSANKGQNTLLADKVQNIFTFGLSLFFHQVFPGHIYVPCGDWQLSSNERGFKIEINLKYILNEKNQYICIYIYIYIYMITN